MSQEKNYFKLGEIVYYCGLLHCVKTLTTINESDILYQLAPINKPTFTNGVRDTKMVQHTDKMLESSDEHYKRLENEREGQAKIRNREEMWDLIAQLKFIPQDEKDRLLVSLRANELGVRNPYLDIFNANTISPEFERHLSGLRKDLYKSLGLDKMLKDDLYQGGVHLAKPAKNGFIVKAKWPKMDEFESPLMKALKKYVEEDLKAAKEAAEMAAEEKKNKMSITVNEEERVVTVVFEDGSVRMSRCSKDDHFDPVIGVAMCIAARKLGSRTKLKKYVESNARFVKPKKKKADTKDETSGK